jgi:transcriptional regulator with XRE-family HTH domain
MRLVRRPNSAIDYIRRFVLRLSQYDFAQAIQVDQPTVSRWEKGKRQPRRHQMIRIRDLALERGIAWEDRWFFAIPPETPASPSSPDAG